MPVRKPSAPEQAVGTAWQSVLPAWLQPSVEDQPSDPWYQQQIRRAVRFFGADDPRLATTNLAMAGEMRPSMASLYEPGAKWRAMAGPVDPALDMSIAARLKRALDQAYGTVFQHETSKQHVKPLLRTGFDPSITGASIGDYKMPRGVFLKPATEEIGIYAGFPGEARQMGLRHRAQRIKEADTLAEWTAWLQQDPEYAAGYQQLERIKHLVVRAQEPLLRILNDPNAPLVRQQQALGVMEQIRQQYAPQYLVRANMLRQRVGGILREQGYEGMRLKEDVGGPWGKTVDTTVILDPAQVRSTGAAFDPKKMLRKALLAGVGGAAVAPAAKDVLPPREPEDED